MDAGSSLPSDMHDRLYSPEVILPLWRMPPELKELDPQAGICSDSCRYWNDCCQCEGKQLTPMGATECTIAMGIVTAVCPWWVWNVHWDGEPLQQLDACDESEPGWTQHPEDGDIVVTLCGDTCAAYLQGTFAELDLDMFCEVA